MNEGKGEMNEREMNACKGEMNERMHEMNERKDTWAQLGARRRGAMGEAEVTR